MERSPREVWTKRVERWLASDLTATEFAAEIGVKPGTLSHWKWQLGWEARGRPSKAKRGKANPLPARPLRKQLRFTEVKVAAERAPIPIEIVTESGLRIRVCEPFDESTLRRVLEVVRVLA